MDRLTNAEVGGPYSNREDAERAIRAGNFDQDPADLIVQEGGDEDDDSGSKQAVRKTADFGMFEQPSTGAEPGPNNPDLPELGQPRPDTQFPQTTKPAQTPGGGGSDSLPQDPSSSQFDAQPMQTPGPNPLASPTAAVVAMIRQANPGIDNETLIRVASKTVAKLVEADFHPYSMLPHIEDPLANKSPLSGFMDLKQDDKGGSDEGDGEESQDDGDKKPDSKNAPLLPRLPLPDLGGGAAGGAAGEAAGGAGEAAGAARLLPMLMV